MNNNVGLGWDTEDNKRPFPDKFGDAVRFLVCATEWLIVPKSIGTLTAYIVGPIRTFVNFTVWGVLNCDNFLGSTSILYSVAQKIAPFFVCSVLLISPLVHVVAGLSSSSSSKADTMNN